ncbi:MAG: helix-hairpin-helix domain-containing protein [Candidatus Zixiibacteriota bacterium]
MPQVACRRFTLRPQSFESPCFGTKLESPFTITLPADSPLCRLFASDAFFSTDLDLPVRPDIPLGIFKPAFLDSLVDVKMSSRVGQGDHELDDLDVDEVTIGLIKQAGIDSIEALAAMSDDQLKAINGIGDGRIKRIRAALEAIKPKTPDVPPGVPDPGANAGAGGDNNRPDAGAGSGQGEPSK